MRARICSATSRDMFARVVWLKSWGAAKPPTFDLSLAACTRHAWLVRLTRARGRRYIRGRKALLYDFWYFSSLKSTRKEKLLYDTYLSEFFSLVRKERKGQKEECFPLLNTFCRLAATSANTLPRPSDHSITTATGSKRSSADSDSLLCHVRLWRTSRLSFWRKYGCEHSEIGFVSAIYCSNTSSVAVNRATFSHWRRLAKRRIIFKVKMYTAFAIQSEKCRLQ